MRIHLLGFMGAGKSSIGPVVARRGGLPFLDLDAEIERRMDCTIRSLFEREGEAAFRDIEHNVLADSLSASCLVLATGGGIVERPENRVLLMRGFNVYLHWPWELLRDRLFAGSEDRPLLDEGGDAMRRRWERRDPVYRELAGLVCELGLKELRTPRRRQFEGLARRILAAAAAHEDGGGGCA